MAPERLRETLGELIDRPFRADQIFQALHVRGVRDFAAMTELHKDLRARLAERFRIGWPEIAERVPSADGTCKFLFRLHDGASIEAVDIPDGDRRTLCISSQAGCALACSFCVTGFWGAGRNLTAGEIVAQVLAIRADRQLPAEGLRLVFMGMGEPLLNLESLRQALDILGRTISLRRITHGRSGRTWRCRCTRPTTGAARRSCRSTAAIRCRSCWRRCAATRSSAAARSPSST